MNTSNYFDQLLEVLRQPKTPREFRRRIESIRSEVDKDTKLRHAAMQKQGPFKLLVEEVMPVIEYASKIHGEDHVLIKPCIGNQGYDVEICNLDGKFLERVEVTVPHNGKKESEDTALAIDRGYGNCNFFAPGEEVRNIKDCVLKIAKKKAKKDYRDSTLLFVIHESTGAWHEIIYKANCAEAKLIAKEMRKIKFQADKVYLLLPEVCLIEVQNNVGVANSAEHLPPNNSGVKP